MFFVIYKLNYKSVKTREKRREIKIIKKKVVKNYLSNSPEMNFSTFSYASSSVY